jgi:hypothetical protein
MLATRSEFANDHDTDRVTLAERSAPGHQQFDVCRPFQTAAAMGVAGPAVAPHVSF